uniref:(California timema) hypothetical protein n=1 Tax=Timema californicum TaxID=61474 RepID=A0A7R9JFB8_TIMCA|nr:unnamed protein product [Timema californicum]
MTLTEPMDSVASGKPFGGFLRRFSWIPLSPDSAVPNSAKHVHAGITFSGEVISAQPRHRSGSAVRCSNSHYHIFYLPLAVQLVYFLAAAFLVSWS